jgi:hypothetical protein
MAHQLLTKHLTKMQVAQHSLSVNPVQVSEETPT